MRGGMEESKMQSREVRVLRGAVDPSPEEMAWRLAPVDGVSGVLLHKKTPKRRAKATKGKKARPEDGTRQARIELSK